MRAANGSLSSPSLSSLPAGPSKTRYENEHKADVDEEDEEERLPPSDSGDSADEWLPEAASKQPGSKRLFMDVEGDSESSGPEPEADLGLEENTEAEGSSSGPRSKRAAPMRAKKPAAAAGESGSSKRRKTRQASVYDEEDPEMRPVAPGFNRPMPESRQFSLKPAGVMDLEAYEEPTSATSASANKSAAAQKGKKPAKMTEAEKQLKKMEQENKVRERRNVLLEQKEIAAAQATADAAWEAVRQRKAAFQTAASGGLQSDTKKETVPQASSSALSADPEPTRKTGIGDGQQATLSSWLGLAPKHSDVPDPTTCGAAHVYDRDSLFIGYVYPLEDPSSHMLLALLTHLTKTIHPTHVPVDLLPPGLRSAPASKRGSSHDMYAYRVLQLKPGRSGTNGPEDFAITEENEDDGEKWASQHILRVMQQEGAVDCLCVVSRWYGGTMLGPDRFTIIKDVARAAIRKYMQDEKMAPIVEEIKGLDEEIFMLRCELQGSSQAPDASAKVALPDYNTISLATAERLLNARKKQAAAFQKRIKERGEERAPESSTAATADTHVA